MTAFRALSLLLAAVAFAACAPSDQPSAPDDPQDETPQPGASLAGRRPFPADNPWNTDISRDPVDPNSATLIASCGSRGLHADFGTVWNGAPNGIPYITVRGSQPRVPVSFEYDDESDPGPYPIPPDAPEPARQRVPPFSG